LNGIGTSFDLAGFGWIYFGPAVFFVGFFLVTFFFTTFFTTFFTAFFFTTFFGFLIVAFFLATILIQLRELRSPDQYLYVEFLQEFPHSGKCISLFNISF